MTPHVLLKANWLKRLGLRLIQSAPSHSKSSKGNFEGQQLQEVPQEQIELRLQRPSGPWLFWGAAKDGWIVRENSVCGGGSEGPVLVQSFPGANLSPGIIDTIRGLCFPNFCPHLGVRA